MLFFQTVLLAGYLYSHLTTSYLPPRQQSRLHLLLSLTSCLFLPVLANPRWKPTGGEDPTLQVLWLLALTVGAPYFVLSTSNPLLGRWFSRRYTPDETYRLFGLSNFGAFLALFAYPFFVEPTFEIRLQGYLWSGVYLVFILLVSILSYRSAEDPDISQEEDPRDVYAGRSLAAFCVVWAGLSCCTSVLLIALTNYLTQNIAAIPFLWTLPLALFLLSFIVTFSYPILYQRWLFWPAGVASTLYLCLNVSEESHNQGLSTMLPMICGSLFVLCTVCHGELSRSRPGKGQMTLYYLMSSAGGALGGLFVGVFCPLFFSDTWELPIFISATMPFCLVVRIFTTSFGRDRLVPVPGSPQDMELPNIGPQFLMGTAAVCLFGVSAARMYTSLHADQDSVILAVRNFYGPMKVEVVDVSDSDSVRRRLTHGTIQHGSQFLAKDRRRWATSYYAEESGVGLAILKSRQQQEPQKVGVVGLGTGTIASYGRSQDEYVYYELNPLVEKLAREYFSFLGDNPAKMRVALGDARVSLEREEPGNFDVLAVDAFSSDSIPIHLLTSEAMDLYWRHLKRDGILMLHISNRYLDLQPVILSYCQAHGLSSSYLHNKKDSDRAVNSATWIAVSRPENLAMQYFVKEDYPALDPIRPGFHPWTDSYSNLLSVLDNDEIPTWLHWLR